MSFWAEIIGQSDAVQTLDRAAGAAATNELSHAWLITGPPGSGRSNLAFRFAAALIAHSTDERDDVWPLVAARTHPDLAVLSTQQLLIKVDEAREIVVKAHYAPAQGRHRVIVIEDADRMPERTSNVLLKALEEPPERTIWILCAPSEADLLPTIRSRARSVRLVTPAVSEVAALLVRRDGCDPVLAERAARLAQSHIGMARRLATDPDALARREQTITLACEVDQLSGAMRVAAALLQVAQSDGEALTEQLNATERDEALRNLGVAAGASVPPRLRGQLRALEDDHERRKKRALRDGIDRILTDLLTLYRDILLTALATGTAVELVNREHEQRITELAQQWGPERALETYALVETARTRLSRSITPGLVLEALFAGIARAEAEGRSSR